MFDAPRSPDELAMDAKAFRSWLQPDCPDEERNLVLRNMRLAIREELSETQRRYLVAYYVEGRKMQDIADEYGRDRSTVSRTLKRARQRLKKVLRYSSRALLADSIQAERNEVI